LINENGHQRDRAETPFHRVEADLRQEQGKPRGHGQGCRNAQCGGPKASFRSGQRGLPIPKKRVYENKAQQHNHQHGTNRFATELLNNATADCFGFWRNDSIMIGPTRTAENEDSGRRKKGSHIVGPRTTNTKPLTTNMRTSWAIDGRAILARPVQD
jgi:hypothetical protein